MSLIWLSPRLPADRSALAQSLGPDVEISTAEFPPAGASLAVATVYERSLLQRFAAGPSGALLLLKPPGTATPADLPAVGPNTTVAEAADVSAAAGAVRSALDGPPAVWPEPTAPVAAPGGWLLGSGDTTGELPSVAAAAPAAAPGQRGRARRKWLASGGIIGAAALAAVVVLATQGGASGTSAVGFRGPGGSGGYAGGFGGPGGFGGFGSGERPGATGTAPGGADPGAPGSQGFQGSGGSDSTDRAAQRQAFLDCLRTNGVDASTSTQDRRPRLDPSDPTVASALEKCRPLLPERGRRDGAGPRGTGPGGMPPAGVPQPGGAGATAEDPAGRST